MDAAESFIGDQAFVLAFPQGHIPFRDFDAACIDNPPKQTDDGLETDCAVGEVFRVSRLAFKKAFHFGLRFKAPDGKARHCFFNDRSNRLIPYQYVPVANDALVFIAKRRAERPIAVHGASAHSVLGLLAILLALMLGHRRQQVLDKDGIGIIAKFDGRAFQLSTCLSEQGAELPMHDNITAQAVDIVDDHNYRRVFLMLLQIGKQRLQSRPIQRAA